MGIFLKRAISCAMVCMLAVGTTGIATVELNNIDNSITADATTNSSYKTWRQGDSSWGNMRLGSSSYTMSNSGCAITALATLMVHAGSVSDSSFNPGVLCTYLNNNGGLSSHGDISWSVATNYASSFSFQGYGTLNSSTVSGKASEIKSYLDEGYYIILGVKSGGHWVAVDKVEGDKVYIFDSANGKYVNVFDAYSSSGIYKIRKFYGANSVKPVTTTVTTTATTTTATTTTKATQKVTEEEKTAVTEVVSTDKKSEEAVVTTAPTSTNDTPTTTTTSTSKSTTTTTSSKKESYTTGLYSLSYELCLRAEATTSSDAIDIVPVGSTINVSAVDGEWGYVCHNGNMGWINLTYTSLVENTYNYSTGTYTTGEPLNYRSSADITSESYGVIPANTTLKVTEVSNNWGKITYNGKTAWVCLDYVSTGDTDLSSAVNVATSNTNSKVGIYTTNDNLSLRKGTSTDTDRLDIISKGTDIDIISINGKWGKTLYNGQVGWVYLEYADFKKSFTNIPCDINADGDVNVQDILYVSDKIKNGDSFTQTELAMLDFDEDGTVSSDDYLLLKTIILY
jgi:uncharacterized protein YgiM (DUF1202 family)